MIKVQGVTRRFGSRIAVRDVSFTVERDEIVGFVGPNGAGKSTMLKMLSTYLPPTSGELEVDGLSVTGEPLAVRRRIGYLAGDTPLYQAMRADRFLRFAGQARGLRAARLARQFDWVVEICGLAPILSQRISECSTGFRQRLGLATALIHDPDTIILDEPTHGFDPLQVLSFRDLLRELRPGRAILFSSHIIQEVEAISDRVLVIHQGRLLGDGTVAQLAATAGAEGAALEQVFAQLVRAFVADQAAGEVPHA